METLFEKGEMANQLLRGGKRCPTHQWLEQRNGAGQAEEKKRKKKKKKKSREAARREMKTIEIIRHSKKRVKRLVSGRIPVHLSYIWGRENKAGTLPSLQTPLSNIQDK
ncbi:hypothetical protein CEXT_594121 [Caerostris extrusa]|uniref:Uncharacterized protein n=1 Tax=Caerostris extrusa TaxID=172846 RepID=A0AAV4SZU4_CAEEX|nr:hypothetical protein CEXT_594121 [Caerostris extrusa]